MPARTTLNPALRLAAGFGSQLSWGPIGRVEPGSFHDPSECAAYVGRVQLRAGGRGEHELGALGRLVLSQLAVAVAPHAER